MGVKLDDIAAAAKSVPGNRFFFDNIDGITVVPNAAPVQ